MKKLLLVAAVAGMALTSCKKDYTCECTTSTNVLGMTQSATASTTIKDTKSKAKEACEKGNSTANTFGGTVTTACAIK